MEALGNVFSKGLSHNQKLAILTVLVATACSLGTYRVLNRYVQQERGRQKLFPAAMKEESSDVQKQFLMSDETHDEIPVSDDDDLIGDPRAATQPPIIDQSLKKDKI